MAQNLLDQGHLPIWDIRYSAYGNVPFWYPPLGLHFFAFIAKVSQLDLPVVISRIMPFIESVCILPTYFLCRYLYNRSAAVLSILILSLTPCFVYWTGISTPQSATIFLIPIVLLLWIRYSEGKVVLKSRIIHLFLIAFLLGANFLIHLTYFNAVIILIFVQLALIRGKISTWRKYADLIIALLLSQLLTIWWWGPKNLYWWWTQALTTSSGFQVAAMGYLKEYGTIAGILGYVCFFSAYYLFIRRKGADKAFYLVPVLWALFPMVESHMENILLLIKREELALSTIVKPIEGFRFYVFLSQPLAICAGLILEKFWRNVRMDLSYGAIKKYLSALLVGIIIGGLTIDLFFHFNIDQRFQRAKFEISDIQAAQWFRANTQKNARILSDYYSAQMFSGIAGGRALLGSMFPLKKVDFPYISDGWKVLLDIYSVYQSTDIDQVKNILKKYNCQYVYYSDNVLRQIEFLVNGYGDLDGLEQGKYDRLIFADHSKTLLNSRYFDSAFEIDGRIILRLRN